MFLTTHMILKYVISMRERKEKVEELVQARKKEHERPKKIRKKTKNKQTKKEEEAQEEKKQEKKWTSNSNTYTFHTIHQPLRKGRPCPHSPRDRARQQVGPRTLALTGQTSLEHEIHARILKSKAACF